MKKYVNIFCLALAVFIGYSFQDKTVPQSGRPMMGINSRLLHLGETLETGLSVWTDFYKVRPSVYFMWDWFNMSREPDSNTFGYSNNKFGVFMNWDVVSQKPFVGFFFGYRIIEKD